MNFDQMFISVRLCNTSISPVCADECVYVLQEVALQRYNCEISSTSKLNPFVSIFFSRSTLATLSNSLPTFRLALSHGCQAPCSQSNLVVGG